MKRNLLLIAFAMFVSMITMAQQPRRGMMFQADELKKELSLNDDQTEKYKSLSESFVSEMQKMRNSGSFDREKMTEMRDKMTAELKKIFNDEQYKKYEAMVEKMRAERRRQ